MILEPAIPDARPGQANAVERAEAPLSQAQRLGAAVPRGILPAGLAFPLNLL